MTLPRVRAAMVFVLGCALGATAARSATTGPASLPVPLMSPLRVHAGGRTLETAEGRPFFWLGDTGWKLLQSATRDEASYYLQTRARQGFTVIQTVVLAEDESILKPNANGDVAFIDQDPTRPNPRFFDHVTSVVDEAARLGLYVCLLPTWGDKVTAPWGAGPRVFRLDNLEVARAYGRFLGERLMGRTHVIWMLGGDRPAFLDGRYPDQWPQNHARGAGFAGNEDWRPIWRAMAAGLDEGFGQVALKLYHPQGGSYSTTQMLLNEPWLSVHGFQSGHGGGRDSPAWELVARDTQLAPDKPTLDLEPNYEDHPYNPWPKWDPASGYFRDHDVRKQVYRGVFAGGCGVTYGHHSVWQFASARNGVINHAEMDWVQGLHRPGAAQVIHLRRLIESRPFHDRIRDAAMVVEAPKGGVLHVEATRDRAGTFAFVYYPINDLEITLDLGALGGGALRGWWYDPRTGFAEPLALPAGAGRRAIRSPSRGPDWVLVVDRAAAAYPAPGLARMAAP